MQKGNIIILDKPKLRDIHYMDTHHVRCYYIVDDNDNVIAYPTDEKYNDELRELFFTDYDDGKHFIHSYYHDPDGIVIQGW